MIPPDYINDSGDAYSWRLDAVRTAQAGALEKGVSEEDLALLMEGKSP